MSEDNMGYGKRTIHVPASGPVADAPRPNAAEPLADAVYDDGVAKVDAELASKDNDPSRRIVKGVKNEYISPETTEGAKNTDNAAVTPADEKPPTQDDMTGVPGGSPDPVHYAKPEDAPEAVKAKDTYGDDDTETSREKAKNKADKAGRDNTPSDKSKPLV